MVSKTLAFGAAALVQFQTALAVPVVGHEVTFPILRRENTTVAPPKNPTPIIHEIPTMTEEELQELIDEYDIHVDDIAARTTDPEPRAVDLAPRAQATEGALVTYIAGNTMPGTDSNCKDFTMDGPFTTIHTYWGTSSVRSFTATSISGNTTDIQGGETISDGGEFKFAENERISKFSVGIGTTANIVAFSFETDAGNTYKTQSAQVDDGTVSPTWSDLDFGSGVLARIRGTSCPTIFGSLGFDFIDDIDSVSITNIDYEGFTENIMPSGKGTEMSVGSQVLDNRNSSVDQTIALTTTDAVTKQQIITSDLFVSVGGKVAVEGSVGIPLISEGKVTTEANWNIQENSGVQNMENTITTRSGTFNLKCPAGKFCTAKAFFTQFKMDVNINATFAATTKSGDVFNWVQSGTYKGADSLAMQFNVTEVKNVQ